MTTEITPKIFQKECLTTLLGSIGDAIVATDAAFAIRYWNPKAADLFGSTLQEVEGKKCTAVLPFTCAGETEGQIINRLSQNGSWKGRVHVLCRSGQQLFLDVTATAVKSTCGQTLGYVGVLREATEYQWAKSSFFTFLPLISATGDCFFVVDKSLNIAFIDAPINRRLEALCGITYSVGDHVLTPLQEERQPFVQTCFQRALNGEQVVYEIKVQAKSGKHCWLRINYFPLSDNNGVITHACTLVKDITPQKEMELVHDKLSHSRRLFETFMENSPIFSWITDKNGTLQYLSPSYRKTFQLPENVIGTPLKNVFPTAVANVLLKGNNRVYRSRKPLTIMEQAIMPDGMERTYQVVKFPVLAGQDVYIGGWAIDTTQASELQHHLSESLRRLQDSEQSLEAALKKEHQINELKTRFVSMASHEFRTPLSTMRASIYLLERYTTAKQQPKRLKHAAKIKEAIQHLNSLLEDFLTLGKLEEGKAVLHFSTFDLNTQLRETIEEIEQVKKEGQVIYYSFSGEHMATTDKKIFRNIILNLLGNAIKFSAEGRHIRINATHHKGKAMIRIRDEGIGISKADQKHLFQAFYRGRNAENIQGTGLGLNIVKQYMELLHGTVNIESRLKKGTCVTFSIPTNEPLRQD